MNIKIIGVKEVDRALERLEKKLARKIIRKSMRWGLAPMLEQTRELAPLGVSRMLRKKWHEAGTLRKTLKVRAARSKGKGVIAVRVASSEKDYKGDQFYAAFPEYGTKRQKAQHYMRRAFDATKAAVIERTIAKIRDEINAVVGWWKRV